MSKELIEITSLLRMRFVTNDTCHKAADRIEELERERDALQADNARLREAIDRQPYTMDREVCEALAATPGQSLIQLKKQILWEAAQQLEPWHMDAANHIRRMINESSSIHHS